MQRPSPPFSSSPYGPANGPSSRAGAAPASLSRSQLGRGASSRRSFPPGGLLTSSARRRRLLRGGDGQPDSDEDEWTSDSSSACLSPTRAASSVDTGSDGGSSGDDTVGAVVRLAKSTRLSRHLGVARIVATPVGPRCRFPSVASSTGTSPSKQTARTRSSTSRQQTDGASPVKSKEHDLRSPSVLSNANGNASPPPISTVPGPNFSPEAAMDAAVWDEGESFFSSEQDTVSFIYEPTGVSDAFSRAPNADAAPASPSPVTASLSVVLNGPAPPSLSPHARPFVYPTHNPEPSRLRGKLSADKARSYRGLRIVDPAEVELAQTRRRRQVEDVKTRQVTGRGGVSIPVMVGPESLPYARNPSGVDGSVLDSDGRLNVWTRSPNDPEPEHVDYLHFQRRPGALNPSLRVLADDDDPESAYSSPSDYAVPCTGPKVVFRPARPRSLEVAGVCTPGTSGPASPIPLPQPLPPPPPTATSGVHFNTNQPTPWAQPAPAKEDVLQSLLDKLLASQRDSASSFAARLDGPISPDFAMSRSLSGFDWSSPSSYGAGSSPFASQQTSPEQILSGMHRHVQQQSSQQHQYSAWPPHMDDNVFRSRLIDYLRSFHDPALGAHLSTGVPSPAQPPFAAPVQQSVLFPAPMQQSLHPPAFVNPPLNHGALLPPINIVSRGGSPASPEVTSSGLVLPTVSVAGHLNGQVVYVLHSPSYPGGTAATTPLTAHTPVQVHPPSNPTPCPPLPSERRDDAIYLPAGPGAGFANGGARRPGPNPHGPRRTLTRRALDSMDVAAGRERQTTAVLEQERLAVLAAPEAAWHDAPAAVVVGDRRMSVLKDVSEAEEHGKSSQTTSSFTRKVRRTRVSLPAPEVRRESPGDDVLSVDALSTMFSEQNTAPFMPASAAARSANQRRIVSEPVKRVRSKRFSSPTAPSSSSQKTVAPSVDNAEPGANSSSIVGQQPTTSSKVAQSASSNVQATSSKGNRRRGHRSRARASSKTASTTA